MTITGSAATLELIADQPTLSVLSDQLALAGAGAATIDVCQVGDWGVSKPAQLTVTI